MLDDDVAFFAAVFDTEPTIAAVNKRLTSFVYRDCPTVRRLAMARQLCSNAQCPTSRAMADRLVAAWWPALHSCE